MITDAQQYLSKKRYIAVIIGSVIILLVGTLTVAYYTAKDLFIADIQETMKGSVEGRHIVIEQFIFERTAMLTSFVNTHGLAALSKPGALNQHLQQWRNSYGDFKSLALISDDGTLISQAGSDVLGKNNATQLWFKQAMATGRYISSIYADQDGEPTLAISIYREKESRVWITRSTLRLDNLYQQLQHFQSEGMGTTYLIDPLSGTYLSQSPLGEEPLISKNSYFNWGKMHFHTDYENHGVEEVGASVYTGADGRRQLEAHCCVRNGQWLVVLEQDAARLDAILNPMLESFFVILLEVTMLLLVLVWLSWCALNFLGQKKTMQ